MALIRRYLESGKPLVGIRTACHAFDIRGKAPPGHVEWKSFDPDVLGGHYTGHHSNDLLPVIELASGRQSHPILEGVSTPFHRLGLALQDQPALGHCRSPVNGKGRQPAERAGRVGQCEGLVAHLLHVAGTPRRFRSARVSPAAQERRLLGTQPPAGGSNQVRKISVSNRMTLNLRRRIAPLLTAAKARSHPRGLGLIPGSG